MQDRYVGDIGDFVKYGLLRAICGAKSLGVAWYLHPNAGPVGDGRHTAYLRDPDEWRHLDADLFDALRKLIPDRRSVANIQQSGILVFADPDNGLVPNDRFRPASKESTKEIPIAEAITLAEGRTAVIYHHNSRRRGGHLAEIRWLKDQLTDGTMAYYWRRVSNRTFFIINADDKVRRRVREFMNRWGDRGVLV